MINELGGFDYTNKKIDDFSNEAIDSISDYDESDIKKSLIDLVRFNKDRKS